MPTGGGREQPGFRGLALRAGSARFSAPGRCLVRGFSHGISDCIDARAGRHHQRCDLRLLALALVLVFAVTRVIFIPQGEFVAYGALTLAMLQAGVVPATCGCWWPGVRW
jgi:hypothetical protein